MYSNDLANVMEILYPFQRKSEFILETRIWILFNLIFSADYIIAKKSSRAL